ncbi:helix-turn-helix domain-containing protein [Brachyspira catarrhinii]|uniref:Helix-turn-helix domain-containing protein n=1 Tax=Brachyspira catarrhinii TaxID=2528966 RepID=A0ABY2TRF2_9SPIR|nr:helix-turn-helix transcriptional regulator [Brachyspira catarrhinii]TKZ35432.1 helix-turn-helix domain-containing protein [Brachyspira catarrhinii]
METIGEILKNAREKKGLTIEKLEEKTRIVARYIKALEDDEFDKLPGEIYIKGFIRNLSDKLSLDSKLLLERYNLQINENKFEQELYKNDNKIVKPIKREIRARKKEKTSKENTNNVNNENQISNSEETEKEVKMLAISNINEEFNKAKPKIRSNISNPESDLLTATRRDLDRLKNSRKKIPVVTIIIILAILVLIAVGIFLIVNRNNNNRVSRINDNGNEIVKNINNSKSIQDVRAGNIINFKPMGISASIEFNRIGNVIDLNINGRDLSLSKGNPIIMDLSGNGINDFKITVLDIYDDLAKVEMERLEENQMVNAGFGSNNVGSNIQSEIFSNANLQVIDGETYILQNIEKSNINIEITARGFVYLRYFIDSGAPSTQNLLSGNTVNLEASDVIMFTIGNAGEVAVRVNGIIVKVGEAGETINKTIKWIRDLNDSTKYNLIMSDTR